MKKSIFIISIVVALLFSFSCVFAANEGTNVVDNIRNTVGGAENVVEDAAKGTAGAIKNGFNTVGDKTQDMMNNAQNTGNEIGNDMQNAGNNVVNGVQNTANNVGNDVQDAGRDMNYTATRTATDTNTTNAGNTMMDNIWTWIIIAIIAVAIIALIWYYSTRNNH